MVMKKEFSVETRNLIIKMKKIEKESIKWMRYPREFEAKEVMLKAHTDRGSRITIQRNIKKKWRWDINGIK